MLRILSILFVLLGSQVMAQNEQEAVKKTIEDFFEGFHAQDSLLMKHEVSESVILQTIGKDETGNSIVKNQPFNEFLKSIVSIPATTKFKEVITNYSIKVDGPMANAWTDYEFMLNNEFHHCGVNSFQLVKDANKGWQIIYLIDTRRKEDCN
ncbi:nuclear transport factor 2 family protein [Euzebyella saccharophila]|uniref:Nuclear transport factor 2 family protein n=1 Tax=Euzebyella saccharophila TaxID=679664 RepID=A0ABV8JWL6_9FLAO|nr:nuclear transport factor 2 family protein [Euzebyella saccharophila]